MYVQFDRRRRRGEALNTMTRARFCRGRVSLSIYIYIYIYTQFLYFVGVDGGEKILYGKVLVKPLASGYVSVFETSCLITINFPYYILFSSDTERVHD
jgi:hypothetical protein